MFSLGSHLATQRMTNMTANECTPTNVASVSSLFLTLNIAEPLLAVNRAGSSIRPRQRTRLVGNTHRGAVPDHSILTTSLLLTKLVISLVTRTTFHHRATTHLTTIASATQRPPVRTLTPTMAIPLWTSYFLTLHYLPEKQGGTAQKYSTTCPTIVMTRYANT